MVAWTSLALLSALAVSALSSPDESAYKIPQVGTGRRSQYSVLHKDGTYKYGYDTGEGAFESARSSAVGQVEGNFGYRDPEGNNINLQYEAGEGGFQPRGAHLPAPHPDFALAHAQARARPPFVDPLADSNADASYGFDFAGDGQARTEQSDSDGNVRGSYTYTDDQGRTRTYTYTAGKGTGFVVEGDDLPQAPADPSLTPAATRLSSSAARFPSSTLGAARPSSTLGAARPSSTGPSQTSATSPSFRASTSRPTSGSPTGPVSFLRSGAGSDASYSFSYDAGDHSRSESADANLNVDGQFSFVADDGVRRRVVYEAGSGTGFVASGDHLPKSPESHFGSQTASAAVRGRPTTYRSPTASGTPGSPASTAGSRSPAPRRPAFTTTQTQYSSPSTRAQTGPFEPANTRSQLSPDGSYSFAYETSSHSRAESGDRDNNVVGDFDFVADDGQRRAIKYEAGSATGFIAEGAHIPVGPEVPGAPSGQPTGRIVPVREVPFIDPLADSKSDASYNFAFDSEQYSRSESADADGNVQGTYTVVDDDGTRRTHRFRAGEGIGFETEEVSSSRGPPPSRTPSSATFRTPASPGQATPYTGQTGATFTPALTRAASAASPSSFSPSSPSTRLDGSNFKLRQYDASENRGKYGYVLTFDN
ncbi:sialidase-like isoform X2 [Procambarus clarkii]|uniref:sialidase-like isoform X2 n=1 Tax=Procambarus clarkii TaxID=6728 RepID=UPI003742F62E